jgi:23S rRNA (cytidine1920-2'-O)/16S rRNA (cytidine1409-2'-O)-methyltransferase
MIRLDMLLVKKKMFKTRTKAQEAIKTGAIFCNEKKITKPGSSVPIDSKIEIKGKTNEYVSRGGLKLEKAIDVFGLNLKDKTLIDIGSSTGGFTDVALKNKVKKVIAIDVGRNQMVEELKNNDKVFLYEDQDFRTIENSLINDAEIATIDVSFISVVLLLNKLSSIENLTEVVCLIKPQFEAGKKMVKKHRGIVLNKDLHIKIVKKTIEEFHEFNFTLKDFTASPIRGGSGNIEYLAYFLKYGKAMNLNQPMEEIEKVFSKN